MSLLLRLAAQLASYRSYLPIKRDLFFEYHTSKHLGMSRQLSNNHTPRYNVVQCRHYQRRCNLIAPCCNRVVCCHRGHDESRHCSTRLSGSARSSVTLVVCTVCQRAQPITRNLRNCRFADCRTSFGNYHCRKCLIWTGGEAFHCDICDCCYSGKRSETRHCPTCKKCYPLSASDHPCTRFDKCSLCNESLGSSNQRSINTSCGHPMHESCFTQRVLVNFSCPKRGCGRPLANLNQWRGACDTLFRHPNTYRNVVVTLFCDTCRQVSRARYNAGRPHCSHCNSSDIRLLPPSATNSGSSSRSRQR